MFILVFLIIPWKLGIAGPIEQKCYQCSQCEYGCQGSEQADNQAFEELQLLKDDNKNLKETGIRCCTNSETLEFTCRECEECPSTGCNQLTGECCEGPEDVPGGCAPCMECGQCIKNTTTCCPATKDCPMRKNVGGTDYTLSYTGAVKPSCLHNCVYHKDGDINRRFCFKRGNQKVSYEEGSNKLAVNHSINYKQRYSSFQYFHGYWGSWGLMSTCPTGAFVYGYRLQSEPLQGSGDDTALNSISLRCRYPNSYATSKYLYSRRGFWGYWGSTPNCYGTNNPVVGFAVLMESVQGGGDDTAANDIDLYCMDGQVLSASKFTSWGSWTQKYMCPSGMAVAGLQTRVESCQGSGDDTALNGIGIYCRPYPTRAASTDFSMGGDDSPPIGGGPNGWDKDKEIP